MDKRSRVKAFVTRCWGRSRPVRCLQGPAPCSSSHLEKRLNRVRFPPHKRPKGRGSGYIIISGEEAAEDEVWTGTKEHDGIGGTDGGGAED